MLVEPPVVLRRHVGQQRRHRPGRVWEPDRGARDDVLDRPLPRSWSLRRRWTPTTASAPDLERLLAQAIQRPPARHVPRIGAAHRAHDTTVGVPLVIAHLRRTRLGVRLLSRVADVGRPAVPAEPRDRRSCPGPAAADTASPGGSTLAPITCASGCGPEPSQQRELVDRQPAGEHRPVVPEARRRCSALAGIPPASIRPSYSSGSLPGPRRRRTPLRSNTG